MRARENAQLTSSGTNRNQRLMTRDGLTREEFRELDDDGAAFGF
jgi:hypothetical protein